MKLKELEKRLEKEPNNLGLRVTVAGLLRDAGRSVEAVELYRSVAIAYRDQGRRQQAIAVCRSILEIAPDDVSCQSLLASLVRPASQEDVEIDLATRPPTQPTAEMSRPGAGPAARPATGPAARPATGPPPPPPARRPSFPETPLPRPVPYHIAEPTSAPARISPSELSDDAETRPGERRASPSQTGLAEAARRISGMIAGSGNDLSAELDTRQRPRVDAEQLRKVTQPPPTVPTPRVDMEELETPALAQGAEPRDSEDELTRPHEKLPPKDED